MEEVGKVAEALDEVLVEKQHAETGVYRFERPVRNGGEGKDEVEFGTWARTKRPGPARVG